MTVMTAPHDEGKRDKALSGKRCSDPSDRLGQEARRRGRTRDRRSRDRSRLTQT